MNHLLADIREGRHGSAQVTIESESSPWMSLAHSSHANFYITYASSDFQMKCRLPNYFIGSAMEDFKSSFMSGVRKVSKYRYDSYVGWQDYINLSSTNATV